jgi:phosphomannomutase
LRDLACSAAVFETSSTRGEYTQDEGAIKRYIDRVLERADLPKDLPPVRLAIDAGNGMSGHVLPELFRRLPSIDVAKLYWELDGTFPHHEANPIKPENVKDLQALVRQDSFLFGVVPDGDSDRIGFVDETGEQIPGDILTALFAQEILATHPGGRVLFDIRSSWSVPEVILEAGGVPEMCRPGHALIKRHMHETGAVFAGELAMHYFFIDFWNCEASELALLLLLRRVIREEKPLSQIWKPLQRYVHSGEINFTVASPVDAVKKIADQYRAEATTISEIDGVRLEFRSKENPAGDWWFNVRPSNTEPVLRLNLEARTKEEMEKRREELTKKILEIK